MTSEEIRQKFLDFFEGKGHKIVPSASLIPTEYGDNGTLFTTAGMQPMIPYLLGKKHPAGQRLVDVQKCVRTGDIDDVGDNRHLTFFEMMGNWSLGDYFKKESIEWSFDFLTNKKYGLGLDPARFYVTTFKGENGIPRDEESVKIWQEVFKQHGIKADIASADEMIIEDVRIVPLGTEDNFWIAGNTGPCGSDTEIFYDVRPEENKLEGKFSGLVDSGRIIEVWNNVFMEFNKTADGKYEPLASKNVDTGMGLERTTAVINSVNVFETDLFAPIISKIKELSNDSTRTVLVLNKDKAERIIADHLRTAVFMIADGVTPANTDRGYILRRIIRRMVRYSDQIGLPADASKVLAQIVIDKYQTSYPNLKIEQGKIFAELNKEEEKFRKTLANGIKVLDKQLSGKLNPAIDATENFLSPVFSGHFFFNLYQSYGFPLELALEEIKNRGQKLVKETEEKLKDEFSQLIKGHQETSRSGAEQKFKGGLAGTGEIETKYHTATHLLLAS
ncbi:MAG: alanine--tRNA ligase-related protein, partial [Candidatus Vogelbacteria bacterium]|nr:alanine--tRNA ligase-related protein [Candidatus Vogelbacteria bacterium]